jgi:hypothetical protein
LGVGVGEGGWGGGARWEVGPKDISLSPADLNTLNTGMRNYPKLVHTLSEKIRNHELLREFVTTYGKQHFLKCSAHFILNPCIAL